MNNRIICRLAIRVTACVIAMMPVATFAAAHDTDTLVVSLTHKKAPMVIKDRFMPTSRRIDREINKNKYVFRGETLLGLTASYGTLTSEDADMFPIFDDIDLRGAVASVNPFIGYFYRDNNCVGIRLGYTHISCHLDNLGMDLGGLLDMDFSIPQLSLASDRYSAGLFHRSYVALDDRGRFGVFGEFEAMATWGSNYFEYSTDDSHRKTMSDIVNVKLIFSPGVSVYAFPNVCATLSFGLGGFKYNYIRQNDGKGGKTGERHFSKLNFRLNLADIRLGLNIHLWNKKKSLKTKVTL